MSEDPLGKAMRSEDTVDTADYRRNIRLQIAVRLRLSHCVAVVYYNQLLHQPAATGYVEQAPPAVFGYNLDVRKYNYR